MFEEYNFCLASLINHILQLLYIFIVSIVEGKGEDVSEITDYMTKYFGFKLVFKSHMQNDSLVVE